MATVATSTTFQTMADVLKHLGDVPPERVRLKPPPGEATEQDVIDIEAREDRLCELIDGILVEKVMGYGESFVAGVIIMHLNNFVSPRDLGIVTGADGTIRIFPTMVRIPDVAFVSWDRLPENKFPADPIPDVVPELAVEVLSIGNTPSEMARKLEDYFSAGVELVWYVDPKLRTVTVFTAPDQSTVFTEADQLDGGSVLPGFSVPVKELFVKLDRTGA